MLKAVLFFVLFTGFILRATGQTSELILTYKQNNEWLDSLYKLSSENKLEMINDRILADTNIFVKQLYPDGIRGAEHPGNRVFGECRPVIFISQIEMAIGNETANNMIIALTKLLNTNNIKDVYIYKASDKATYALYGTRGENGVILMKLKEEKFIKKFKKLKLNSNH
jgi:hypothetical protein